MNRIVTLLLSLITLIPAQMVAQTLSLDSCRARALRSNKQMSIARTKQKVAENARKAVRTKYLPHVEIGGAYMYSSREISLLNDDQKAVISNLGTLGTQGVAQGTQGLAGKMQQIVGGSIKQQAMSGNISPQTALALGNIATDITSAFGAMGSEMMAQLAAAGDALGERIVDAFRTNTHHIFTASAMVTQPIFMGGAITAANRMADITEQMATTGIEAKEHDVTFAVDNAYWMVVSLKHKQQLADAYLALVRKLNTDVHKMIANGVATRADGLKVDVAVNEAEMTKAKVDNGLTLARMLLCEQCGMPLDSNITLEDEDKEDLCTTLANDQVDIDAAKEHRPELRLLGDAVALSKQQTRLAKAGYMPQIAFMGGAIFSSPSVYNGFERKFKGALNLGVMLRMPVFDWGETMYRVRASKNATNIAMLQYDEASEMVELQISQCTFKVREANKNLASARNNIQSAEENLRCANVGFKEGVIPTSDVMAAQTAWLQAQTQKVDAEIDVKMSETALKKAIGDM